MAVRSRVADILIRAKVIDDLQLRSALAHTEQWGVRLAKAVVDLRFSDEEKVTDALAKATNTPRTRLGNINKDQGALGRFDVGFCEQKGIFPVQLKDGGKTLVVAVADPTDLDLVDAIAMKARARVVTMVASEGEIERAILKFYKGVENPELQQTHQGQGFGFATPGSGADLDSGGEEEEEFKIVDMSGKTVMKRLADIVSPEEAAKLQASAAPASAPPPTASAGDLLDEILSGAPPPAAALTPEELQRLESVRVNQEKSSKILRALLELLFEKRRLSREELSARVKG